MTTRHNRYVLADAPPAQVRQWLMDKVDLGVIEAAEVAL